MIRNFDYSIWRATAEYSSRAAAQIVRTGTFGGQAYAPIPLSNSEFPLIDSSNLGQCHPSMLLRTDHTTLYWGSAGHPLDSRSKSQMILGSVAPTSEEQARDIRKAKQLILGATVCEAAIARIPQDSHRLRQTIAALIGHDTLEVTEHMYARAKAPVALIQAGRIVRNGQMDDSETNSRTAILWYPPIDNPVTVLAAAQEAIGALRSEHIPS